MRLLLALPSGSEWLVLTLPIAMMGFAIGIVLNYGLVRFIPERRIRWLVVLVLVVILESWALPVGLVFCLVDVVLWRGERRTTRS